MATLALTRPRLSRGAWAAGERAWVGWPGLLAASVALRVSRVSLASLEAWASASPAQ